MVGGWQPGVTVIERCATSSSEMAGATASTADGLSASDVASAHRATSRRLEGQANEAAEVTHDVIDIGGESDAEEASDDDFMSSYFFGKGTLVEPVAKAAPGKKQKKPCPTTSSKADSSSPDGGSPSPLPTPGVLKPKKMTTDKVGKGTLVLEGVGKRNCACSKHGQAVVHLCEAKRYYIVGYKDKQAFKRGQQFRRRARHSRNKL